MQRLVQVFSSSVTIHNGTNVIINVAFKHLGPIHWRNQLKPGESWVVTVGKSDAVVMMTHVGLEQAKSGSRLKSNSGNQVALMTTRHPMRWCPF